MTQVELKELIKKSAEKSPELMLEKRGYFYSPFVSIYEPIKNHEYSASYYSVYKTHEGKSYVTVLSFYNGKYILKCGDPYLEGKLTPETLKKLINVNCEKIDHANKESVAEILKSNYNLVNFHSDPCGFNQKNYEVTSGTCKHIATFLHDLPKDIDDKLYKNYFNGIREEMQPISKSSLDYKLKRYAFKKHILLEGDKGSGKTYSAINWTKTNKLEYIFVGGHEQFESTDFLGHYIQNEDGKLIWKDGPLSEAFRIADSGRRIVLIIDEMLRIPKRELNILVSSLSSINGKYFLRTNRALNSNDGIASEEILIAPSKNLWVLGTTNVGSDYAVDSIDEALSDRFKPIRKDTQEDELRAILMKTVDEKSFSMRHVDKLMGFYSKMQRLHATEIIKKIVNIRHLNEAVEFARVEEEIKEVLEDSILLWVERDFNGKPNDEQYTAVKSALRKIYD